MSRITTLRENLQKEFAEGALSAALQSTLHLDIFMSVFRKHIQTAVNTVKETTECTIAAAECRFCMNPVSYTRPHPTSLLCLNSSTV